MSERVVLVDVHDKPVGTAGKLEAHRSGRLHRAFSVFLTDSRGRWLLQRRASRKYHSGGLWSNACCSHPRPGEGVQEAATRRLQEEMGVASDLSRLFSFVYRAELNDGLIEHELDHVLLGRCDQDPDPDPREVEAWRWISPHELGRELRDRPDRYTSWFRIAVARPELRRMLSV